MANIIDARGRSCPEPVIMTKNEIDKNSNKDLQVLVDTHVAVENITRFVTGKGYNVNVEESNGEYKINIKK
ncbi:sulfurtransferase TusA family protein [Tissierella praeacuta]|uniref:TusA-related sulfurtransferase n=1 Tax=Tissierella praeacuta DSM 18095 TaxID=1123404 RepID=A0A1M4YDE5_9FIRM|nr:sulfurtransferase TusA family protein [Tissierella praeacuta]MBU5256278.1 sulfurtransferase TusA family protein [Tissierella praeacuta]TCU74206.1 TusA-related sulfurtransferase [Tissierella praeacuta]SHF03502.1 TusA-related sulfurtransferase [Tissierella praeacuta DSM 18095]SUP03184.1 selenium metabolism protein YedF [Tissierella praeacuta]